MYNIHLLLHYDSFSSYNTYRIGRYVNNVKISKTSKTKMAPNIHKSVLRETLIMHTYKGKQVYIKDKIQFVAAVELNKYPKQSNKEITSLVCANF